MTKQFLVMNESQFRELDGTYPFIVLTRHGQPVSLIAKEPFAGESLPESKSAAVLIVPRDRVSSERDYPKILAEAYVLLQEAIDAEGVILVDEKGEIFDILPTTNVLAPRDKETQEKIQQYFRERSQQETNYKPLAGNELRATISVIYSCPVVGCNSPDVKLWQKGREIPPCPYHNKPRERRYVEVEGSVG